MFPLSRESFRTFHELSEIFSDENNHSLSRELLIKVGARRIPALPCSWCFSHRDKALAELLELQTWVQARCAGRSFRPRLEFLFLCPKVITWSCQNNSGDR